MPIPRLAALTGLAVLGALCAGTAASVYTAATPRRELHAQGSASATPWEAELGANPAAPELLRSAGASALPAAARLRTADLLVHGACLQVREMLFGPVRQRFLALDSLERTLASIPGGPAASTRARAALEQMDDASLSTRVSRCRRSRT